MHPLPKVVYNRFMVKMVLNYVHIWPLDVTLTITGCVHWSVRVCEVMTVTHASAEATGKGSHS